MHKAPCVTFELDYLQAYRMTITALDLQNRATLLLVVKCKQEAVTRRVLRSGGMVQCAFAYVSLCMLYGVWTEQTLLGRETHDAYMYSIGLQPILDASQSCRPMYKHVNFTCELNSGKRQRVFSWLNLKTQTA